MADDKNKTTVDSIVDLLKIDIKKLEKEGEKATYSYPVLGKDVKEIEEELLKITSTTVLQHLIRICSDKIKECKQKETSAQLHDKNLQGFYDYVGYNKLVFTFEIIKTTCEMRLNNILANHALGMIKIKNSSHESELAGNKNQRMEKIGQYTQNYRDYSQKAREKKKYYEQLKSDLNQISNHYEPLLKGSQEARKLLITDSAVDDYADKLLREELFEEYAPALEPVDFILISIETEDGKLKEENIKLPRTLCDNLAKQKNEFGKYNADTQQFIVTSNDTFDDIVQDFQNVSSASNLLVQFAEPQEDQTLRELRKRIATLRNNWSTARKRLTQLNNKKAEISEQNTATSEYAKATQAMKDVENLYGQIKKHQEIQKNLLDNNVVHSELSEKYDDSDSYQRIGAPKILESSVEKSLSQLSRMTDEQFIAHLNNQLNSLNELRENAELSVFKDKTPVASYLAQIKSQITFYESAIASELLRRCENKDTNIGFYHQLCTSTGYSQVKPLLERVAFTERRSLPAHQIHNFRVYLQKRKLAAVNQQQSLIYQLRRGLYRNFGFNRIGISDEQHNENIKNIASIKYFQTQLIQQQEKVSSIDLLLSEIFAQPKMFNALEEACKALFKTGELKLKTGEKPKQKFKNKAEFRAHISQQFHLSSDDSLIKALLKNKASATYLNKNTALKAYLIRIFETQKETKPTTSQLIFSTESRKYSTALIKDFNEQQVKREMPPLVTFTDNEKLQRRIQASRQDGVIKHLLENEDKENKENFLADLRKKDILPPSEPGLELADDKIVSQLKAVNLEQQNALVTLATTDNENKNKYFYQGLIREVLPEQLTPDQRMDYYEASFIDLIKDNDNQYMLNKSCKLYQIINENLKQPDSQKLIKLIDIATKILKSQKSSKDFNSVIELLALLRKNLMQEYGQNYANVDALIGQRKALNSLFNDNRFFNNFVTRYLTNSKENIKNILLNCNNHQFKSGIRETIKSHDEAVRDWRNVINKLNEDVETIEQGDLPLNLHTLMYQEKENTTISNANKKIVEFIKSNQPSSEGALIANYLTQHYNIPHQKHSIDFRLNYIFTNDLKYVIKQSLQQNDISLTESQFNALVKALEEKQNLENVLESISKLSSDPLSEDDENKLKPLIQSQIMLLAELSKLVLINNKTEILPLFAAVADYDGIELFLGNYWSEACVNENQAQIKEGFFDSEAKRIFDIIIGNKQEKNICSLVDSKIEALINKFSEDPSLSYHDDTDRFIRTYAKDSQLLYRYRIISAIRRIKLLKKALLEVNEKIDDATLNKENTDDKIRSECKENLSKAMSKLGDTVTDVLDVIRSIKDIEDIEMPVELRTQLNDLANDILAPMKPQAINATNESYKIFSPENIAYLLTPYKSGSCVFNPPKIFEAIDTVEKFVTDEEAKSAYFDCKKTLLVKGVHSVKQYRGLARENDINSLNCGVVGSQINPYTMNLRTIWENFKEHAIKHQFDLTELFESSENKISLKNFYPSVGQADKELEYQLLYIILLDTLGKEEGLAENADKTLSAYADSVIVRLMNKVSEPVSYLLDQQSENVDGKYSLQASQISNIIHLTLKEILTEYISKADVAFSSNVLERLEDYIKDVNNRLFETSLAQFNSFLVQEGDNVDTAFYSAFKAMADKNEKIASLFYLGLINAVLQHKNNSSANNDDILKLDGFVTSKLLKDILEYGQLLNIDSDISFDEINAEKYLNSFVTNEKLDDTSLDYIKLILSVQPELVFDCLKEQLKSALSNQNSKGNAYLNFIKLLPIMLEKENTKNGYRQELQSIFNKFYQDNKKLIKLTESFVTIDLLSTMKVDNKFLVDTTSLGYVVSAFAKNILGAKSYNVEAFINLVETEFKVLQQDKFKDKKFTFNQFKQSVAHLVLKTYEIESLTNVFNNFENNEQALLYPVLTKSPDGQALTHDDWFKRYIIAHYFADKETIKKCHIQYLNVLIQAVDSNEFNQSAIQKQLEEINKQKVSNFWTWGTVNDSDPRYDLRQSLESLYAQTMADWNSSIDSMDNFNKVEEYLFGFRCSLLRDYAPDLYLKLLAQFMPRFSVKLNKPDIDKLLSKLNLGILTEYKPNELFVPDFNPLFSTLKDLFNKFNLPSSDEEVRIAEDAPIVTLKENNQSHYFSDLARSFEAGVYTAKNLLSIFIEYVKTKLGELTNHLNRTFEALNIDDYLSEFIDNLKSILRICGIKIEQNVKDILSNIQSVVRDLFSEVQQALNIQSLKLNAFNEFFLSVPSRDNQNAKQELPVLLATLLKRSGLQEESEDYNTLRDDIESLVNSQNAFESPYLFNDLKNKFDKFQFINHQNELQYIADIKLFNELDKTKNKSYTAMLTYFNLLAATSLHESIDISYISSLLEEINENYTVSNFWNDASCRESFSDLMQTKNNRLNEYFFSNEGLKNINTYQLVRCLANDEAHDNYLLIIITTMLLNQNNLTAVNEWLKAANDKEFMACPFIFKTNNGKDRYYQFLHGELKEGRWTAGLDVIARQFINRNYQLDNKAKELLRALNIARFKRVLLDDKDPIVDVKNEEGVQYLQSDSKVFYYDETNTNEWISDLFIVSSEDAEAYTEIYFSHLTKYINPNTLRAILSNNFKENIHLIWSQIFQNFDFEKFVRDLDAPDSSLSTFLSTAYINLPDYFTEHFKKKDENSEAFKSFNNMLAFLHSLMHCYSLKKANDNSVYQYKKIEAKNNDFLFTLAELEGLIENHGDKVISQSSPNEVDILSKAINNKILEFHEKQNESLQAQLNAGTHHKREIDFSQLANRQFKNNTAEENSATFYASICEIQASLTGLNPSYDSDVKQEVNLTDLVNDLVSITNQFNRLMIDSCSVGAIDSWENINIQSNIGPLEKIISIVKLLLKDEGLANLMSDLYNNNGAANINDHIEQLKRLWGNNHEFNSYSEYVNSVEQNSGAREMRVKYVAFKLAERKLQEYINKKLVKLEDVFFPYLESSKKTHEEYVNEFIKRYFDVNDQLNSLQQLDLEIDMAKYKAVGARILNKELHNHFSQLNQQLKEIIAGERFMITLKCEPLWLIVEFYQSFTIQSEEKNTLLMTLKKAIHLHASTREIGLGSGNDVSKNKPQGPSVILLSLQNALENNQYTNVKAFKNIYNYSKVQEYTAQEKLFQSAITAIDKLVNPQNATEENLLLLFNNAIDVIIKVEHPEIIRLLRKHLIERYNNKETLASQRLVIKQLMDSLGINSKNKEEDDLTKENNYLLKSSESDIKDKIKGITIAFRTCVAFEKAHVAYLEACQKYGELDPKCDSVSKQLKLAKQNYNYFYSESSQIRERINLYNQKVSRLQKEIDMRTTAGYSTLNQKAELSSLQKDLNTMNKNETYQEFLEAECSYNILLSEQKDLKNTRQAIKQNSKEALKCFFKAMQEITLLYPIRNAGANTDNDYELLNNALRNYLHDSGFVDIFKDIMRYLCVELHFVQGEEIALLFTKLQIEVAKANGHPAEDKLCSTQNTYINFSVDDYTVDGKGFYTEVFSEVFHYLFPHLLEISNLDEDDADNADKVLYFNNLVDTLGLQSDILDIAKQAYHGTLKISTALKPEEKENNQGDTNSLSMPKSPVSAPELNNSSGGAFSSRNQLVECKSFDEFIYKSKESVGSSTKNHGLFDKKKAPASKTDTPQERSVGFNVTKK